MICGDDDIVVVTVMKICIVQESVSNHQFSKVTSDLLVVNLDMFRFLIKNELLFVAEREIEVHIWKVVYYQVLPFPFSPLTCSLITLPLTR